MTLLQYYSLKENFSYVNQSKDAATKQRRIAELRTKFEQSNFSSDDKAEFGQPERTETAFNDLRRITVVQSVQSSIKRFLTSRNDSLRKQKEKQKEREKQKQNNHISHPFWF